MSRPMSKFPDKRESAQSAKNRLAQLLVGCSDAALATFTPDHLAATHRVPVRECEYLLTMQRSHRQRVVG